MGYGHSLRCNAVSRTFFGASSMTPTSSPLGTLPHSFGISLASPATQNWLALLAAHSIQF